MKLEGDYIIFTPPEAGQLRTRHPGDQWRYKDSNVWNNCSYEGGHATLGYTNDGYLIRRLIQHCTPEQLAEVGHAGESVHFL